MGCAVACERDPTCSVYKYDNASDPTCEHGTLKYTAGEVNSFYFRHQEGSDDVEVMVDEAKINLTESEWLHINSWYLLVKYR